MMVCIVYLSFTESNAASISAQYVLFERGQSYSL